MLLIGISELSLFEGVSFDDWAVNRTRITGSFSHAVINCWNGFTGASCADLMVMMTLFSQMINSRDSGEQASSQEWRFQKSW